MIAKEAKERSSNSNVKPMGIFQRLPSYKANNLLGDGVAEICRRY